MRFSLLLGFLLVVGVSHAQTATLTPTATMTAFPSGSNILTCNGLPCGSLIWTLPAPPVLYSPTPLSGNASIGSTATATITPTQSGVDGVNGLLGNVTGMLSATPIMTGTPYPISEGAVDFFGYMRAITLADFGVLNPLILFLVSIFALTLGTKILTFTIPIIALTIGFIRKLIELIPGE